VHKSGGDGASTTFLAFRHEFVGYAVALNAAMLEVPDNSFVAVLPPIRMWLGLLILNRIWHFIHERCIL
jgi:hypothetical protein